MTGPQINRREFAGLTVAGIGGGIESRERPLQADDRGDWDPDRPLLVTGQALRVQPVLTYATAQRREKTSWRSWGRINSKEAVAQELDQIRKELSALAAGAGFPLEVLAPVAVASVEEARRVGQGDHDVVLIYPATGTGDLLTACFPQKRPADVVIFARHESGPTYYGYEYLNSRLLKTGRETELARNSAEDHGPVTVDDVVIDDVGELRWRLRALYAVKNFIGHRIVAVGGPMGKWDPQAPKVARERYHLDIVDVSYDELASRLKQVRADTGRVARARTCADRYLASPGTTLSTDKTFVVNAFLLYGVFKDLMRGHAASAFTIQGCMNTVIPMSETTACMPLSWINDEGLLAFCESDFVIIPAGILLHYICGKPVFLHNSTFPHRATVTCAHCTAPRRMDGVKYEPTRIMTHYESDYGAAPKVDMTVGQEVTFIDPEYSTGRWVGFKGTIRGNPCHEICRTQQDVEIQGDWQALRGEARDSHWVMVYGDHLKAAAYAARKIGVRWVNLSESSTH